MSMRYHLPMVLKLADVTKRVETRRFGPFLFQMGFDPAEIHLIFQRVLDAQERFKKLPLSEVAVTLEKEVIVSSVYGTNTIEGGTLTKEETERILNLPPEAASKEEERRAINIKAAYDLALGAAQDKKWQLSVDYIHKIHSTITGGLSHPHNQPGLFRNNQKDTVTHVGNTAHGGVYKPPQLKADIELLMGALVDWHNEMEAQKVPALFRAPLVHLYYELIHPFWDGNGRVGRVLEATILKREDFQYAPFAMADYYLGHIDEYFTLFNVCRKNTETHKQFPNTPFINFHLKGLLEVINRLHDRVSDLVRIVLFEVKIKQLFDEKKINSRQYSIVTQVMANNAPLLLSEMKHAPWHRSLYLRLTEKTEQRDLKKLLDMKLLIFDAKRGRLWPGFVDKRYLDVFEEALKKGKTK